VRWDKLANHLAQQGIFTAIRGVALGQNEAKARWHAIPVPCRHQQHEAQAKKPGMRPACPAFLRHRVLGAAFVGVIAIAKQIQHPISRWWQGGQEGLRPPVDEQMHVPVGGFEQAAKAPRGDGRWSPPGHLFQGVSPRVHGLHEDQPTEDKAMATTPHGGHATKHQSHKTREVGEGHQHMQRSLHGKGQRKKWTMGIPTSPLHLSALICKGLTVYGVNSEYDTLAFSGDGPLSGSAEHLAGCAH
jgi:hypothetical protein